MYHVTTWLFVWLVESFHKGRSHNGLHLTLHCAWAFPSSWQQDPRIDQPFPRRCTCRRVCGCHMLCGPSGRRHKRAVPCCCTSLSFLLGSVQTCISDKSFALPVTPISGVQEKLQHPCSTCLAVSHEAFLSSFKII